MPNQNPQQTTPQQQIARAAESTTRVAERLESSAESAASMALDKVRQVREEAQSGIEQQREEIAHRIRRVSDALRLSGQSLSTDDALSQQLFDNVGDRVERIADYVATVTPGELASDVQSLARRRPGLFFGGSFILGLALGRFAKSSAGAVQGAGGREEYRDEYEDTIAVRPSSSRAPKSSRTQRAGVAGTRTTKPTTATASAPSTLPQGVSSSGSASSTGSSSASSTGSTTATTGSAGTNAAPAYGTQSSTPAAKPQSSNEASGTSAKAHSVEPGEGSKS